MIDYPHELLPQNNFKLKIEFSLEEAQSLDVIRRSLVGQDETTNDLGSIRSHSFLQFEKEHLFFGLSTNLFGIFKEGHLIFRLGKTDGGEYYTSKDQIPALKDVKYDVDAPLGSIYLNVGKVHGQPFHYETKKNEKIYKFIGTCSIVHKPLRANYWHFEIEVLDEKKQRISQNEAGWKKTAAKFFFESYLKLHLSPIALAGRVDSTFYIENGH